MHLNACVDIISLFILKFWGICSKGVKVGEERWRELSDLCEEHIDDHVFGYYDAGFMMAFAQGGQDRCVSNMLESISNAIKHNKTPNLRSALKMHTVKYCISCSLVHQEKIRGFGFFRQGPTFQQRLLAEITLPVCQAIASFENKDYAKVFETLFPLRYQLWRLGGSGAQV